ncbi:RNA-directed DNA polymerase, eukaryota, reverse transcriptase zinc-binding domain protein [Tanacetum coccineum]
MYMCKSKILGIHVNNDNISRAAEDLGCQVLKWPFSYLGSMVGGRMHRLHSWDDTVDRVRNRLSKWKMKMLSSGGRLTLVKSVLGSMPIFHMSLFKVPAGILHKLESIRKHFFNGHEVSSRKISWVNWNKVISPKEKGGLGVSSLYALNRGLLFKWVWRFLTQGSSLWARVIKAIHGMDGSIGDIRIGNSKSCWSSIINEINVLSSKGIKLMNYLRITLGNGVSTRLWDEPWHVEGILKDRFPRIYALENCKSVTVGDKLAHQTLSHSFRRLPRGGIENAQFAEFSVLLQQVVLAQGSDRWTWTANGSGQFSVASVRKIIDNKLCSGGENSTRWIRCVPNKINIHAWKVMTESLATRFDISRRGIVIDSILCGNCDIGVETTSHLFFTCDMATSVRRLINRWWEVPDMEIDSYATWKGWIVTIRMASKTKLMFEELPIPATPVPAVAGQQVPPETLAAHAAWVKGQNETDVLMLMTMEPDLQRNLETLGAYDMLKELKTLSLEVELSPISIRVAKEQEASSRSVTLPENGTFVTKMSIPVTAKEKTNKKNDVKARSLLLMALPNEHQLTFSQYSDAKTILQKIFSRLKILGVVITQEDLNSKLLRSLPPEWNTYVKSVGASSGAQNLAFMTAPSTSSTNDINTANPAYEVSNVSPNINTACPQDLEQIHKDYLEAMDLKWQLSLLSIREKRYFQRTGKKIFINANDTARYDKSKVECFNCHKMGYFARECRAPKNKEGQFKYQDNTRKQGNNEDTSLKAMLAIDGVGFDWSDMAEEQVQTNMALMAFSDSEVYNDKTCTKTCLKNYETLKKQCDDLIVKLNQTEFTAATYKRGLATVEEQLITYRKNEVLFSEEVAVLKREVACKDYEINVLKSEFEKVKQEKEGIEFKIEKFNNASKSLDKLLGSQITDKSKKGLGYNAIPPPYPLIYNRPKKLDLSYSGLDEFKSYGSEDSKQESNIVCDKKSDDSKENSDDSLVKEQVSEDTSSFVKSSLNVDKETVFLVDKKIEFVKPKNHENQLKSQLGKPQQDDTRFINSGCSRDMTGNIAYLSDFKEFNRGYLTFGGGAHGGRISGKGTLKTNILDFEDVYFVNELNFNLKMLYFVNE